MYLPMTVQDMLNVVTPCVQIMSQDNSKRAHSLSSEVDMTLTCTIMYFYYAGTVIDTVSYSNKGSTIQHKSGKPHCVAK